MGNQSIWGQINASVPKHARHELDEFQHSANGQYFHTDSKGNNLLMKYLQCANPIDLGLVRALAAQPDININKVNLKKQSVIMVAATRRQVSADLLRLLVERGANACLVPDPYQCNVLMVLLGNPACTLEMVQYLVEIGVDPAYATTYYQVSALHIALKSKMGSDVVSYIAERCCFKR